MDARHRVASAKSSIVHVGQLAGHTTIKRRAVPVTATIMKGATTPNNGVNGSDGPSAASVVGEKRPRVEDDNATAVVRNEDQEGTKTSTPLGGIDGDSESSDDDLEELQAAQRQQQQQAAAAAQAAQQQQSNSSSSSVPVVKKAATSGAALASYTSDTLFGGSSRKQQPTTAAGKGKSVNQTNFMKKFFK